jgi:hypothetical protein
LGVRQTVYRGGRVTGHLPAGTLRSIERDLEPCLGRRWLHSRGST